MTIKEELATIAAMVMPPLEPENIEEALDVSTERKLRFRHLWRCDLAGRLPHRRLKWRTISELMDEEEQLLLQLRYVLRHPTEATE